MPTSTTASHRDPAIQVERPLSYGALSRSSPSLRLSNGPFTSYVARRLCITQTNTSPPIGLGDAPPAGANACRCTNCGKLHVNAHYDKVLGCYEGGNSGRLSINMHNLLQREWDAFFHRMGHLTTPSSHAASTLSAANARMADAIPSSADAPYGGTFACASARSQAPRRPRPHFRASPSTTARPTRRGNTLTSSPSTDPATASFMPVIHDEHGALGTDGRKLARKQNLRTRGQPRPGVLLRYASAGRYGRTPRTRDLAHQSAPRAPRTKGPVEPDDPLGPHHTVGGGADIDSPGLAGGPARGDGRVRSGPHPRA